MKSNEGGNEKFIFKEFEVSHAHSSMKVGVDGVLVGAWSNVDGLSGLDIGCGCGLLALMAVQRNPAASVLAVDIDRASVDEAGRNFSLSPWSERLAVRHMDATLMPSFDKLSGYFDFIISNPPFFTSGICHPESSREIARHAVTLSPSGILVIADALLKEGGSVSLIMPYSDRHLLNIPGTLGIEKQLVVADRPGKAPKRILICLRKGEKVQPEEKILYIRDETGQYSGDYKTLTKAFYLKF